MQKNRCEIYALPPNLVIYFLVETVVILYVIFIHLVYIGYSSVFLGWFKVYLKVLNPRGFFILAQIS